MITQNLLSPPILFFALGMLATLVRSNLTIPSAVARALSVYLLFAIGFHGGVELARSGFGVAVVAVLVAAVASSALLPVAGYLVLRMRLDAANAAAIAACYGSVSAVTFITAISFLERGGIPFSGYMVAAMALMESPAIITAVLLARWAGRDQDAARPGGQLTPLNGDGWRSLAQESLANGAVLLLLGSLVIGYVTGEPGWESLRPLVKDPFQGLLCLFLLDMGLVAAKRLGDLRRSGALLVSFSLIAPPVQAGLGIVTAAALGLSAGDALLLAVLFGSASYIAVPAALRLAIPQANPSLYVPMSLGLTFPLNIIVGIPLYMGVINWWWT